MVVILRIKNYVASPAQLLVAFLLCSLLEAISIFFLPSRFRMLPRKCSWGLAVLAIG